MNFDVQVIDSIAYIFIVGRGWQFTVIPLLRFDNVTVAEITEWLPDSHEVKSIWIDRHGNPTCCKLGFFGTKIEEKENYGWLIDLTMEHGLRFPAIEEQLDVNH